MIYINAINRNSIINKNTISPHKNRVFCNKKKQIQHPILTTFSISLNTFFIGEQNVALLLQLITSYSFAFYRLHITLTVNLLFVIVIRSISLYGYRSKSYSNQLNQYVSKVWNFWYYHIPFCYHFVETEFKTFVISFLQW